MRNGILRGILGVVSIALLLVGCGPAPKPPQGPYPTGTTFPTHTPLPSPVGATPSPTPISETPEPPDFSSLLPDARAQCSASFAEGQVVSGAPVTGAAMVLYKHSEPSDPWQAYLPDMDWGAPMARSPSEVSVLLCFQEFCREKDWYVPTVFETHWVARAVDPQTGTVLRSVSFGTRMGFGCGEEFPGDPARQATIARELASMWGLDSLPVFRLQSEDFTRAVFTFDGSRLLAVGGSAIRACVRGWEVGTWTTVLSYTLPYQGADPVVDVGAGFSPDGLLLAGEAGDNTRKSGEDFIRVLDADDGAILASLPWECTNFPNETQRVIFSPNGDVLAASGSTSRIKLWNVSDWTGMITLTLPTVEPVGSIDHPLAFSGDGGVLASAAVGGDPVKRMIVLWETRTGEKIQTLVDESPSPILALALSPDGRLLVSGDKDGGIKIWDVGGGDELRALSFPKIGDARFRSIPRVYSLAISPDGETLAAGGTGGVVQLWDIATGESVGQLLGCSVLSSVFALAFSPDGQLLASTCGEERYSGYSGGDGAVWVWEMPSK